MNDLEVTQILISITPAERSLITRAAKTPQRNFQCFTNVERGGAVSLMDRRLAQHVTDDTFTLTAFGRRVVNAVVADSVERRAKAISFRALDLAQLLPGAVLTIETVAHMRGLERELLPLADKLREILGETPEGAVEVDGEERYSVSHPMGAGPWLSRADALDVIWRHTHKDFRGVIDGAKTIMVNRGGLGTCTVQLDALSYYEVHDKLQYAWRAEQKELAGTKRRAIKPNEVEVYAGEYERAHGKKPSGRGTWAFFFPGDTESWFPPGNTLYTEAKRLAKAEAIRRGQYRCSVGA